EQQPISHFMTGAYVYLGIEHIYEWLANGVLPPTGGRVTFDADGFVTDEFGNPAGGVRSPQMDVPTHTHITPNTGDHNQCTLGGYVVPLPQEQLDELYGNAEGYAGQLVRRTYQLIEQRWFPDEYLFEIYDEI